MAEITGRFDVDLSKGISVSPDFGSSGIPVCECEINRSRIKIEPLKITEAIFYPDGEYESPRLTGIRVSIMRNVDINVDKLELPHNEQQVFESVLVEATRRFIALVKHKTNQWDLDTRHPVYAYSYEFSCGNAPLQRPWPLEEGTKRLPEYATGTILTRTADAYDELSRDVWTSVVNGMVAPPSFPLYDELLADAKMYRFQMQYDSSVLFAAIATELMLEKTCQIILRTRHDMTDEQAEAMTNKLNIPGTLDLVHKLAPTLPLDYDNIRELFQLRNKIVHGQSQNVAWQKASEAVNVAEHVREALSTILPS